MRRYCGDEKRQGLKPAIILSALSARLKSFPCYKTAPPRMRPDMKPCTGVDSRTTTALHPNEYKSFVGDPALERGATDVTSDAFSGALIGVACGGF
jgi:hypothetical protein